MIAMTIQYLRTGRVGHIARETDGLKDIVKALQAQHADDLKERDLQFARQEGFIKGLNEQIQRYETKREESIIERAKLREQVQTLTAALARNEQALVETQQMLGGKVAALESELETTRREKSELEISVKELNTFRLSLEENNQKLTLQNQYLKDNNQRLQIALEGAGIKVELLDTNILGMDNETPTPELPSETEKPIESASGQQPGAGIVA